MGKYEHKEKSNVLIYHNIISSLEVVKDLSGYAPLGRLFLDIMHYSRDNTLPEYSTDEAIIHVLFNQIKDSIDTNRKKYEEQCIKNANNRNPKKNTVSEDNSQFINPETGEVIEDDDSKMPTEKMILDFFVKEMKKPLTTKQAQDCLEFCIAFEDSSKSWKENCISWSKKTY